LETDGSFSILTEPPSSLPTDHDGGSGASSGR